MNQSFEGLTPDLTEVFLLLDLVGIASPKNRAAVLAHANTSILARALNILQLGILNQENFNAVIAHANSLDMANALNTLYQAQILHPAHSAILIKHPDPFNLATAFCDLNRAGILNPAHTAMVIKHSDPSQLSESFCVLHQAGILNPAHTAILVGHTNPFELAYLLCGLSYEGILNSAHGDMLSKHPDPSHLARAFDELHRAGISRYSVKLSQHPDPYNLAVAFINLYRIGILNSVHSAMLIAHTVPLRLADVLCDLNRAGILNSAHRAMLSEHPDPFNLARAFINLHRAGILNPAHRAQVIAHPDPYNLARTFGALQRVGMLTAENRALAVTSSSHRLTIPCAVINIDRRVFYRYFSNVNSILILTSNRAEYERISALIPEQLHRFIQPIGLFSLIKEAQRQALNDVDVLSLDKTRLPDDAISLVHEYEQPFNDLISQLPLPFEDDELPGYLSNLHRVLEQCKQQQLVIDKLHKLITSAEAAISTAGRRTSLFNLATLDEKQAQVNAIEKLTRWLGDDELRLSAEEIALLAASRSVRLILENNPLQLAKLSELKGELWRHEQERLSLSQQRFLFRFFPDNPHSSRQAFDRQYGMVLYRG